MTEKEFILVAFEHIYPDALDSLKPSEVNERIDNFLEYHHKEYLPVYFIRSTAGEQIMKLRQTHTLATLPISREAYMEIANKLLAAGYGQSFLIRGQWKDLKEEIACGRATIDMHGIGLALEEEENVKPQVCIICGSDQYPLDLRGEVCIVCGIKPDEEIEVKSELSVKDKNYHITETNMEDF